MSPAHLKNLSFFLIIVFCDSHTLVCPHERIDSISYRPWTAWKLDVYIAVVFFSLSFFYDLNPSF